MASAMSASSGRPWAIVSSAFHVSDETLTKMLRSPPVICGKGCTLSAAASTVACALSRASLRSGIYLPPPGSLGDCRLRRQGRRVQVVPAQHEHASGAAGPVDAGPGLVLASRLSRLGECKCN